MDSGFVPLASVIALVRADISNVPIFHQVLMVIVPVTLPVLLNTAVSWGNGKLAAAGEPPLVVAQPVAPQLCAPAKFQYTVLAAGNVMLALPLQSPSRVPDQGADAPAAVISLKSTSVIETDPAVIVTAVPRVLEFINSLEDAPEPAEQVKAFVTVILVASLIVLNPVLGVIPVNVRLLKVGVVPLMLMV